MRDVVVVRIQPADGSGDVGRRLARMDRVQVRLVRRVETEHGPVGDDGVRPRTRKIVVAPPRPAVPVAGCTDLGDARDQATRVVRHQDDGAPGETCDVGREPRAGKPDGAPVDVARRRRVDVAVAIDLRGLDEPEIDAALLQEAEYGLGATQLGSGRGRSVERTVENRGIDALHDGAAGKEGARVGCTGEGGDEEGQIRNAR